VLRAARRWKDAGGAIDLENPDHRFWMVPRPERTPLWLEEAAPVDRRAASSRRISALPFRRPVGLDPRLARAAANLARVRLGGRVVDPFVGTGALLAEAALLGARVVGIDRDPTMIRGALRNFAHLGVTAEAMVAGDSGEVEFTGSLGPFDAVLSDLPYGRASGTGGEDSARLARRVLPRWADRVRPGGRVVLVLPGGEDPVASPWSRVLSVSLRVHRSLTREFRVYERSI
jgi:tRNA (guanine10-N2)-dimethyltransferase